MDLLIGLRQYFQGIADKLAHEKKTTEIFSNKPDAGVSREKIFQDFLVKHLPLRCKTVTGGFIFDDRGNCSKQIDLIVINDLTLQFNQSEKTFNCVEGCYAAISIKTSLDKKQLEDSLDGFASIPLSSGLKVNPQLDIPGGLSRLPIKIIFAFDGISHDTLLVYLNDYYSLRPNIAKDRMVDLVVINNKFLIVFTGTKSITTKEGVALPPKSFHSIGWDFKEFGWYGLFFLLAQIQVYANYGSQVLFNFSDYIDSIPKEYKT